MYLRNGRNLFSFEFGVLKYFVMCDLYLRLTCEPGADAGEEDLMFKSVMILAWSSSRGLVMKS